MSDNEKLNVSVHTTTNDQIIIQTYKQMSFYLLLY